MRDFDEYYLRNSWDDHERSLDEDYVKTDRRRTYKLVGLVTVLAVVGLYLLHQLPH